MTKEDRISLFSVTRAALISWIAMGALLAMSIYRLSVDVAMDGNASLVPTILGALLLIAIALSVMSARNDGRLRYVRSETPDAYAIAIELYADSITQIRDVATSLPGRSCQLRGRTFALLKVRQSSLEILGGAMFGFGGHPKVLASVALPDAVIVAIKRAPQGLYNLNILELSFDRNGQRHALNLLPVRTLAGIVPGIMGKQRMVIERYKLESTLGSA